MDMDMETAKTFFLWCTLLSYGILFIWTIVFRFARDWHYNLTVQWLPNLLHWNDTTWSTCSGSPYSRSP